MTVPLFLLGFPNDLGGANTESWHTLRLWRQYGLDVTVIPTWQPDPFWTLRLQSAGCRVASPTPGRLAEVPDLPGATVVSFCNSRFLRHADKFRKLGCRIVWVNCMTWLSAEERLFSRRHGPFDAYVFQSRYQRSQLLPQLRRYGVQDRQCHLIHGAFWPDDYPFRPRPHLPGTHLVIGRISRPSPDKFAADTWSVYGSVRHPIRARVLGWDPAVEDKLGRPPRWAECLLPGSEPPANFYASLHVMVQLSGGAEENWPRSALEAMSAGVPIIAENRWGWREMIRHGETGFLCDTRDEIVRTIERLASDERLRLAIAHSARNRLLQQLAAPQTIATAWRHILRPVHQLAKPQTIPSSVSPPYSTLPHRTTHPTPSTLPSPLALNSQPSALNSKIAAVCCTYRRPRQLGHLIQCFLKQDYPRSRRELVILDDAGQYDDQQGDGWRLVSVPERYPTLGEKRNAAAALVSADVDALAVWDDDDLYLPWALRASVAALSQAPWSRPGLVLHQQPGGALRRHKTGGLFHGGWAYSRDVFNRLGGYAPMNNGEDQQFARRMIEAGVRWADPVELGFQPFYIYRLNESAGYHLSNLGPQGYEKLAATPHERSQLVIAWPRDYTRPRILPGIHERVF